jgi:murein DD-endopeptidase MepM/ murein hydrolase activator NlpD
LATPFKIRPPEDVAFAYGFDKSKIMQAVANQELDETSAVMAAMLINAGQRQQAMQAGQQPTVAQQVFGGQPPAPPAGLGATPQAAAMPSMPAAPQMGAMPPQEMAPPQMEMPAEEMPMMADGGMVPPYASGGGLSDVPLPDGMFDEPSNGGFGDGYAGGGMVAFAQGDKVVDPTDWMRSPVTSKYGVKRSTGAHQGVDFGVGNRTPIGTPAPGKVIKAATDNINGNFVIVEHPDGSRSSYSHLAEFNVAPGQEVGAGEVIGLSGNTGRVRGKNGGHHLHFGARDADGNRIDPMDFFKRIAPQVASGKFRPYTPERDISTAEGRGMSMEDSLGLSRRLLQDPEEYTKAKEDVRARYAEMQTPEYYEKQRKDSMWETLANIGFNMASSKAPSLLQAIGEAAAAAMPGAQADKKERKALKDRALDGLLQLGAKDRAEAKDALALGMDIYQTGVKQEQFDQELGVKNRQLDIQSAEVQNQLAKIIADSQGKENTKERFIETFYNVLKRKGYSENAARQWAYIAAEKQLAKVKGESGGLFGDEETGGTAGQKSVDQYDYSTMK